jgi:hypothetical protein
MCFHCTGKQIPQNILRLRILYTLDDVLGSRPCREGLEMCKHRSPERHCVMD